MVAAELLLSRDAPRFIDLVECRKVEGNLEEIMPESKLTLPPDAAARLRMLESEPPNATRKSFAVVHHASPMFVLATTDGYPV